MNTDPHMKQWPEDELQRLSACPVCDSVCSDLLHAQVKDWSFFSAPGEWNYWRCKECASVFLNPRPSSKSISRAYQSYYTHTTRSTGLGFDGFRARWKNERLSMRLNRNIQPRLNLPPILKSWLNQKANRMGLPFGWSELCSLQPGTLMDVGCGAGITLALARQLGWEVQGLELDELAVKAAREKGLAVQHGGFERLTDFPNTFDAIVCSHVIEHVFEPVQLIELLYSALRPGGVLLLSTPNAESDVHAAFGKYWRGLEAPRHLVLMTQTTLLHLMTQVGFQVEFRSSAVLQTTRESARIARQGSQVNSADRSVARSMAHDLPRTPNGQDFIDLLAFKDVRVAEA